jgi:tetratricopeptide (TPR) repeat protein
VSVKLSFRQLLLAILALWRGRSQKEIGAAARIRPKRVSQLLTRDEIDDDNFDRLLKGIGCRPSAVPVVASCLDGLEAQEQAGAWTDEELAVVEEAARKAAGLTRETLFEALRRSRALPVEGYTEPSDLVPARQRAEELYARLKPLSEDKRLAVVRAAREYQSWALCERVCEQSVREASRNLEHASSLARLAEEIAQRVRGPESWRDRVRGFAMGHRANILRVSGELKAAEAAFEEAKRLWHAGSDPGAVLDPGRLLDLEASLCRDQRRFEEALALLDQARGVSRCPVHTLISKGFTLEVMGEYDRAVEALLQAESLVDREAEPRLWYKRSFNLAVSYCHLGRYREATELLEQVRDLVVANGDENEFTRVIWLAGRLSAGLSRPEEAKRLLEQARREFAARKMWYDVALAVLELSALLLDEGRIAEVKTLSRGLAEVFKTEGVHREALAALRLFQEASEREMATADLARRVLRFLFRARYDQGLQFES